jgi:hypothetical protein
MNRNDTPVNACLERQAKERNSQMEADAATILATKAGRRLLMNIIAKGGVYAKSAGNNGDPSKLFYTSGRRDAAVDLLAVCNKVAPNMVLLAMQENNERIEKFNAEIEAAEKEMEKGE